MDYPIGTVVGVQLLLTSDESDKIFSVSVVLTADRDPQVAIPKVLEAYAAQGLRPLTPKEYADFCMEQAREEQARLLAEMTRNAMHNRATDPEAIDRLLAGYKGREGGDA